MDKRTKAALEKIAREIRDLSESLNSIIYHEQYKESHRMSKKIKNQMNQYIDKKGPQFKKSLETQPPLIVFNYGLENDFNEGIKKNSQLMNEYLHKESYEARKGSEEAYAKEETT